MRHRTSRLLFAGTLALAIIASAVAPALAAPPSTPRSLLRPPTGANPLSRLRSAALPAGVQQQLMPMGGTLGDYLNADTNWLDLWSVPLHEGQVMDVTIRVPRGTYMVAAIWDNDPDSQEPIVAGESAGGTSINLDYSIPTGETQWYHVAIYGIDGAGRYTMNYDFSDPSGVADVERISGADRITTAIQISKASYPTVADTVVVATGWNFADALAASGLCGSYDAPLLLTRPTSLPSEVLAEIQRLQATQVFVIGSDKAVSSSVFSALQGGGRTVERLEGGSRFETAAQIALKIKQHELAEGRTFTGSAFIVNGMNFPDALAVAPYAFKQRIPILPVLASSVPPATQNVLASLGTTEAIIVGGPTVVGNSVVSALNIASKPRVEGPGRTETAIAAANFAVGRGWASWDYIGLATGWNFPDALGGGANVGKNGGVMLLSKPQYLNSSTYQAMRARMVPIKMYGSTKAIAGCIVGDIDWALYGLSPDYDDIPWRE